MRGAFLDETAVGFPAFVQRREIERFKRAPRDGLGFVVSDPEFAVDEPHVGFDPAEAVCERLGERSRAVVIVMRMSERKNGLRKRRNRKAQKSRRTGQWDPVHIPSFASHRRLRQTERMTDDALEERFRRIESHAASLEHMVDQLNQVIVEQDKALRRLAAKNETLSQTVETIELERIKGNNAKPPHYSA